MGIEIAVIKYLITSGKSSLRIKLDSELIPIEYLIYFASSNDAAIREKIAANKNIPTAIIEKLSYDDDRYVRKAIVNNPKTPYEIIVRLQKDEYWMVSTLAHKKLMFK